MLSTAIPKGPSNRALLPGAIGTPDTVGVPANTFSPATTLVGTIRGVDPSRNFEILHLSISGAAVHRSGDAGPMILRHASTLASSVTGPSHSPVDDDAVVPRTGGTPKGLSGSAKSS